MSDIAISVEGVSKRYLVGHELSSRQPYASMRDVITRGVRGFVRKTIDLVQGGEIIKGDEIEEFWALKEISFQVRQGEVVGIIGRNGAGKSTLLKVLSRITEPTEGMIRLRGRIASLLEVGTGFHSELTGRENIFLNGAILGMGRADIQRKFDEIVAFAEVERFIDTPVKRYSSGMYVRLAFAVAAHLEPDILIIDEVLAVGDAEFQRKCLGKMEEVAGHGRTVLLVSHNTHAVQALCNSAIALDKGKLIYYGQTDKAIQHYHGLISTNRKTSRVVLTDRVRNVERDPRIRLLAITFDDNVATLGQPLVIKIEVQVSERMPSVVFGFGFCSRSGIRILSSDSDYSDAPLFDLQRGTHIVTCTFPSFPLAPGDYLLDVGCRSDGLMMYDEIKEACLIEVLPPKNASPQLLQKYSTCLAKSTWGVDECITV